jgi:uncharacterized membrane protein YhaH (DUF805 family)
VDGAGAAHHLDEENPVTFADAVRTCLSKYADFTGRARRSEYWYFVLFEILVSIAASIIDAILGTRGTMGGTGVVGLLAGLALLLPGLAVTIRRLHDIGRSGWWWLISLIPIVGWIIILVWTCTDSQPGANQYGASPKEIRGAGYGHDQTQ